MTVLEQKEATIRKVLSIAKKSRIKGGAKTFAKFVEAFFVSATPDAVTGRSADELFAMVLGLWKWSEKRQPGKSLVRVFNPTISRDGWTSKHSMLQVANDDMPFIVDSVTAGVAVTKRMGMNSLYHPVIQLCRNERGVRSKVIGNVGYDAKSDKSAVSESYIHIELDSRLTKDEARDLEATVHSILADVRVSVKDWRSMMARAEEAIASLRECPAPGEPDENEETCAFINWLIDNNFTFLGYREYRFSGNPKTAEFKAVRGSGLGLLRDSKRHILRGANGLTHISPEIREFLSTPDPIIITKANVKTQVHRPVHLDYIGVKIFDRKGKVIGERRFVGLFTSISYARRAEGVPLLRRKLENVQRGAYYDPNSHAGKALAHILDTFPRDELFQIGEKALLEMCLGILHLMERPRPRVFARCDKFERFVSALVYVPRENYNSNLRIRIGKILAEAFNGEISVYYAQLSDVTLARWHFIIRTKPGNVPQVDMDEINRRVEDAAKPWSQHLRDKLIERNGEKTGLALAHKYQKVFPLGFREAFLPHRAASDVLRLETLDDKDDIRFEIYRLLVDPSNSVRLKIYHASETVPLSECLPRLEHLGLRVIAEHAYEIRYTWGGCVHDFYMESADGSDIDVEAVDPLVEHLLAEIWAGRIEDDSLNALCLHVGLEAEKIVILRAVGRYLRQIGLSFSQDYVNRCMVRNGDVSALLVELFDNQLNPVGPGRNERAARAKVISGKIKAALDNITSLDDDRILRSYLSVILAVLRTNFYTPNYMEGTAPGGNAPGLAMKIRSRNVPLVPKPRPYAEIFVYSPKFEGVHLRGGPVARGGLRWSDRPEDFRTEILGLVKAQMVKNAVIVPVGAKGGFVPKGLPSMKQDRDAFIEGGTACYKSFITSLLSVTDNLKGGRAITPKKVVRWDDADPYLVVAADKGTATFSDTANGIAIDHGFWLGDAFASGGSVGYDHKKMGITARGAWVSVARHFREIGTDISKDPTTVVGIGDMSGDVFGNGMLLSKALKLQLAFNHLHIFFDPDPDPVKSFNERNRLFKLPRSGWSDYNEKLISKGGGVFERSAKSIHLTPELKAFLGVDSAELTPNEVINYALKAQFDLLWIGGIGTYVKAVGETNADVGDRANDAVRINGRDLRAKVVGEGGNLGMTQRGRIEFARAGGRLNTDFVDNSAGVDCSDKEVNIKILLADAVGSKKLSEPKRVKLLAKMTKDVGRIVLEDNYLQTQAISIVESQAAQELTQHLGLIRVLEREERLDREIEFLPSDEEFSAMALNQQGLTRPELAVVVSYAKMSLYDILLQSDLLDSPLLQPELEWGFPQVLVDTFPKQLARHQLRREIVATTLANEIVNRAGMTFVHDVKEETGLAVDQIASAFLIVRDAFGLNQIWDAIDKLDYKISAAAQIHMHGEVSNFLKKQATWFLRNMPKPLDIEGLVSAYQGGLQALFAKPEAVLSPLALEQYKERVVRLKASGVPGALARNIAGMQVLTPACDIMNAAIALGRKVEDVGTAYFEVGHRVGFDWLRQQTEMAGQDDHWDRLAIYAIIDDFASMQRELTKAILAGANGGSGEAAVKKWMRAHGVLEARADRLIDDLKSSGAITVAKLSFAARHIRSILPL